MKSTNQSTSAKAVALAIGSAFVLTIGASIANAAENPFAVKSLSSGYQVAEHHEKAKDGKCGEGKCSAEMKKSSEKATEGKCGEGKCSAEMKKEMGDKATEHKCSAEGKCSAEMKKDSPDKSTMNEKAMEKTTADAMPAADISMTADVPAKKPVMKKVRAHKKYSAKKHMKKATM